MPSALDAWLDALLPVFATILGEERTDAIRKGWLRHAATPQLVLAAYGLYNSGKTALLKRQLLDEESSVPNSVVVGARPTTLAVHEVAGRGYIWRDTPGLGSDTPTHDLDAEIALLGSDVLVIVLLPQLLAGCRDAINQVLSGRIFHPDGLAYPAGAVLLVVTQMDKAGLDPRKELDEYRQLLDAKRQELQAQLAHLQLSVPAIHFVIPDFGGQVGNRSDVSGASYDTSRAWDGMAEFTAALSALPAERVRLREAAGVRWFLKLGQQVLAQARRNQDAYQALESQIQPVLAELEAVEEDLDLVIESAEADLVDLLESEILEVARHTPNDIAQLRQRLEPKLEAALGRWHTRHTDALVQLAERLEAEDTVRRQAPPTAHLAQALEPPSEPAPQSPRGGTLPTAQAVAETLRDIQKHAERTVKFVAAAHLGMSVGEARQSVRKVAKVARFKSRVAASTRRWTAQTQNLARSYLLTHDFVTNLAPTLIEITQFVLGKVNEYQEAQQATQRRRELQEHLKKEAQKLAELYLKGNPDKNEDGWLSLAEALRDEIDETRQLHHDEQAVVREERSRQATAESLLQRLLDEHP